MPWPTSATTSCGHDRRHVQAVSCIAWLGWHTPTLVADLNPTGDAQPGLHLGLTGADDDGILLFDATGANGTVACGR